MEEEDRRPLRPRAYQLEMLQAALRENVIVCVRGRGRGTNSRRATLMPTPTLRRAILRMQAELERTAPEQVQSPPPPPTSRRRRRRRTASSSSAQFPRQLAWFLAPTVLLAQQQHETIRTQLAQYGCRVLVGADGTDLWSTQAVWDAALLNVRVVVSTPQILLDALANGFVAMRRLALLVFDEAHMAMKASVSNTIMQRFYHPHLLDGGGGGAKSELPRILGLTASPITSKLQQMA
ncbi:Dicer-like protein 2, partial [Ascosphaera acerosa]